MSRPSHSQIWTAIDQLAARFDMTTSALAKVAGLDPTEPPRSADFSHPPLPHEPVVEAIEQRMHQQGLRPFPMPRSAASLSPIFWCAILTA